MLNRKINEDTLHNIYKNAHIALQSISDLLPEVHDEALKNELEHQYEAYDKLIGEISAFMKQNEITPKDISTMKKMMLKASVKMNAAKSDNRSQIAEMMIKGTIMGITDATRELSENEGQLALEVEELVKKLLDLEEHFEKRLKEYL